MKQQIKLTEADLYSIIKETVTSLLNEYGDKPETRGKMAAAAKRSIEKGDDSTYHNAMNSLHKRGSTKGEMSDFQEKFEENKENECGTIEEYTDFDKEKMYGKPSYDEDDVKDFNEQPVNTVANESKEQFKVTESQLKDIIKESVNKLLSEIDWRTISSAAEKAAADSLRAEKPSGFRAKRGQQYSTFKQGIHPQMKRQYNLSNDEVADAIKGKGPFYDKADRRALRQMDKLNADYEKYHSADPHFQSEYKDGKWT
jgi:hypothetical protein